MPPAPSPPPAGRTPLPVVRLAARAAGATTTGDVRLSIAGQPVHLELTVPEGPAPLGDLLPVFQGLTGTLPRPTTTIAELVDRRLDVPPLVSAMAPDLGRAFDGARSGGGR